MDLGGAKGGVKSDINVTPLVDVMLVLLIIMMLVAPLLAAGRQRQAADGDQHVDKPETQDQTVVAIAANKALYLNAKPIQEGELGARRSTSSSRTRRRRSSSSRPMRKSTTAP